MKPPATTTMTPLILILLLLTTITTTAMEDDIRCLQGLKSSLTDSQNRLSSWSFINNNSVTSLCKLVGICTWLSYLVTLDLSGNSLTGNIPVEIQNCKFLNNLILSDNSFSGTIPYHIGQLEWLKKLDVSNNELSGSIPDDLNRFHSDSFVGIDKLCGPPVDSKCGRLNNKNLAIIIAAGVLGAAASFS
uniref:Putative leucine-rich repeat protein, plant-type n=1 Tax=Helianthus annuus TaxID=4232 RepID=A0A251T571_HELAN